MANRPTVLVDDHGSRFRLASDPVLVLLLAISLGFNLFLGVRLQQVNAGRVPSRPELAIGTQLPALEGQDLQGKPIHIAYTKRTKPLVIYAFSPACSWCTRNIPNIKAITDQAPSYDVIAVSLDPDRDRVAHYLTEHELHFSVIVQPGQATIKAYGLGATPMTIVASPTGKVQKVWIGAYVGRLQTDVGRFLSVDLPGASVEPGT